MQIKFKFDSGLANRWAERFSKQRINHAARVLAPTLLALSVTAAAHAQGAMDFSGAQTLMGTFKTPSFVAQRLKLVDLVPAAVEAFYADVIGVGHALLLARLPADQQETALSACFKEIYNNGSKPTRILLPVRNLQFWIDSNILLVLKDVPFNKRDAQLVPSAGSCADCPKRTGHNKLLFSDLAGNSDDCKLCGIWATASLSCWLFVAAPTA